MKKLYNIITIGILLVAFQACDYNKFDNPPVDEPANLTPTHTINQLKSMHAPGGTEITDEIIIGGKVISEDREGNFYKSLVIQDNSSGINIKLNSSGLYNFYKPGQMVFLKCKGLQLGAYAGLVDIGAIPSDLKYETDFIPDGVIGNYLFKGEQQQPVEPFLLTIGTLSKKYEYTLIQLDDVQFLSSELVLTYADLVDRAKQQNRTLVDKNGKKLIVRTSGYARFAGEPLAKGSGSIVGILTYFNTTPQLILVKLSDVMLNNERFAE